MYTPPLLVFDFSQNWVFDKLHGRVNPKKVGDMGIDGYVDLDVPCQVKQSEGVGRNVVDNFETAIRRIGKKKGVIVAFSFGSGAHEEVARVKNQEFIDIKLEKVEEILKKSHKIAYQPNFHMNPISTANFTEPPIENHKSTPKQPQILLL